MLVLLVTQRVDTSLVGNQLYLWPLATYASTTSLWKLPIEVGPLLGEFPSKFAKQNLRPFRITVKLQYSRSMKRFEDVGIV